MKPFATALLLCACLGAHAAPPSAESIERLMAVTQAEKLMERTLAAADQNLRQSLQQRFVGQTLSPEQRQVIDLLPTRFMTLMREELDWARLKPEFVRLYQEALDQEEVDGLIAFYASPAGQAVLRKLPLVVQRSMELTQQRLQLLSPKLRKLVEEALIEAQGAGKKD